MLSNFAWMREHFQMFRWIRFSKFTLVGWVHVTGSNFCEIGSKFTCMFQICHLLIIIYTGRQTQFFSVFLVLANNHIIYGYRCTLYMERANAIVTILWFILSSVFFFPSSNKSKRIHSGVRFKVVAFFHISYFKHGVGGGGACTPHQLFHLFYPTNWM